MGFFDFVGDVASDVGSVVAAPVLFAGDVFSGNNVFQSAGNRVAGVVNAPIKIAGDLTRPIPFVSSEIKKAGNALDTKIKAPFQAAADVSQGRNIAASIGNAAISSQIERSYTGSRIISEPGISNVVSKIPLAGKPITQLATENFAVTQTGYASPGQQVDIFRDTVELGAAGLAGVAIYPTIGAVLPVAGGGLSAASALAHGDLGGAISALGGSGVVPSGAGELIQTGQSYASDLNALQNQINNLTGGAPRPSQGFVGTPEGPKALGAGPLSLAGISGSPLAVSGGPGTVSPSNASIGLLIIGGLSLLYFMRRK